MDGENRPALVALRDRRDAVIQILTDGFTRDVLDVDAFEERVDLAHRATSLVQLDELVKDLEVATAATPASTALTPTPTDAAIEARRPAHKRFLAIFSGFQRRGAWMVPRQMRATAVFGGGQLDFRDAHFGPGVTELRVTAIMGGLDIVVPPTLAVECDGTGIFGGFEERGEGGLPDPDRPLFRITGYAIMGGVSISTRLPGESERQARRRTRRRRRELQRGGQALDGERGRRSLPPQRDD